jgi:hypothetical protein
MRCLRAELSTKNPKVEGSKAGTQERGNGKKLFRLVTKNFVPLLQN